MQKLANIPRPLKIISALFVVLIIIMTLELTNTTHFIGFLHSNNQPSNGPSDSQRKEEAKTDADKKQQVIEGKTDNTSSDQTSGTSNIELSARQEQNSTITIFTKLSGYASGTCTLEIINGAKSVKKTAEVIYQPEYSSCAGFSVPVSELGSGDWRMALTITSGSSTNTKVLTTKVN